MIPFDDKIKKILEPIVERKGGKVSYLAGKRFEYRGEGNAAGTKTGVIVSESFRVKGSLGQVSCVAILWDDGSMEGAIDVELLKVVEKDAGYVVCATWNDSRDASGGTVTSEGGARLLRECESMKDAEQYCEHIKSAPFNAEKTRIGKLIFPFV